MKIKTVTYQENAEIKPYQHKRVGATAEVERGETPEQALADLTDWVQGQLYDTVITITEKKVVRT